LSPTGRPASVVMIFFSSAIKSSSVRGRMRVRRRSRAQLQAAT
jgi:hypothetical protein